MSTQPACALVERDGLIQCEGLPITGDLSAVINTTVGPVITPASGNPGRTRFSITYTNSAQPAIDSTRFTQLRDVVIGPILSSFAGTLGNARDTSLASNAIQVNVTLDIAPIAEAYRMTVLYGASTLPPPYTDTRIMWRMRITKYYAAGVIVQEIPLDQNDPTVWPDIGMTYLAATKELKPNFIDFPTFLVPPSWFPLTNIFAFNTQFYWDYVLPSGFLGSVGNLNINNDAFASLISVPPNALGAPFFFNAATSTFALGTTSAEIGLNILGYALSPQGASLILDSQSQTQLWDSTGVPLPVPKTPCSSFTCATAPLIFSSQWRFMRILPDWLQPAASAYRTALDGAFASSNDIKITLNADSPSSGAPSRLSSASSYYFFGDSYIFANQSQRSFKTVLVHEMMHGLGCSTGVGSNVSGAVAMSLYNHYTFTTANKPLTPTEFSDPNLKPRQFGQGVNVISNGFDINAPIDPATSSHLLRAFPMLGGSVNGIMESTISPGNIIPTGTAPNGGPSQNDYDILYCCSIFSTANAICVHENTVVNTLQGDIQIKDIQAGDLVQDASGSWVPVKHCIEIPSNINFVVIPTGALDENVPSSDLYIRSGHPILINGREVDCDDLLGATRPGCQGVVHRDATEKGRCRVYTLVTEKRTFVKMQNTLVGTWSEDGWNNYRLNDAKSSYPVFCDHQH